MMNGFEYAGMDMVLASSFRAAIYCRLSKDDDLDGESASIANQRAMLETYCEKQGWEVVAVYQDDGYTGLNMERPDLKRMLKAIERRQINLVVTKDLSRLGRNYLQTGFLIEDFFPRNGVRYIAMNDGIDTMRDNNDTHCPASVCVGAGRTRPQLHPAQAGRRKNPMPDLLEPGAGLSERVNQVGKERPGQRAVYVGLLRD